MKKLIPVIFFILFTQLAVAQMFEQNSGVSVSLNSVSVFDLNNAWVCGANGTVLRTTNGGNNWLNVTGSGIPVNVTLVNIFAVTPSLVLTAGYSGTDTWVWRTTNSGINWQQVFSQPGGFINALSIKNDSTGFMIGDPVGGRWSIWKTSNSGATWDSTNLRVPQISTEAGYSNCMVYAQSRIWYGTSNSRIYYSSNNGSNWTVQSTSPEIDVTSMWFDPNGNSTGYFGGNNIFKSTNFGINWANIGSLGTGLIRGMSGFPMWSGNVMYVRNASSSIYYGFGTGQWFVYYTAPAGSYNHIGVERNSGWPIVGYAVRTNGGITKFNVFVEGINQISAEIPIESSLSQNYPNPFNPVTHFGFRIAEFGLVKLTIYDALGKVVHALVNQQLQPGIYEADWDASAYPSGVYYYKLAVKTSQRDVFTETKKMVLIK